jgi:DNA-binding NarL/FixJ family response regulator
MEAKERVESVRTRRVRILVVEDHWIVREGLRTQFDDREFEIVAEASTAAEAIGQAVRHRPDVVLLDLHLPDAHGPSACAELAELLPEGAVIVLSADGDAALVTSVLAAGARGYLLKDTDTLDLAGVVKRVLAGETVIDPRAAAAVVRTLTPPEPPEGPRFSERELEILRLAAEGCTNPEIGARLFLSKHTVKEYLSSAMRKLEVTGRLEAVLAATRLGLIGAADEAGDSLDLAPRAVQRASRAGVSTSPRHT